MRVKFHREYDHTFESRAMMNFPAGYEGTVKQDVGEAAIAAGAASLVGGKSPRDHADAPKRRGRKPRVQAALTPAPADATPAAPEGPTDALPPQGNSD